MEGQDASKEIQTAGEVRPHFDTFPYKVEGYDINVYQRDFHPEGEENRLDEGIFFIPGWSAGTSKNIDILCQTYANEGKADSFAMNPIAEKRITHDRLLIEARAAVQRIKESGKKKVTLVGYSEGGAKAMYMTSILQKECPEIEIEGLVLLAPVGLYDQTGVIMAGRYVNQGRGTTKEMERDLADHPEYTEHAENWKEWGYVKEEVEAMSDPETAHWAKVLNYLFFKLRPQIADMTEKVPVMNEIRCPVVLVQGINDKVSNPEVILNKDKQQIKTGEGYKTRLAELKKYFPQSEVSMVVPSRMGWHGFVHFRPEQVAKTTLYQIERIKRRSPSTPQTDEAPAQIEQATLV